MIDTPSSDTEQTAPAAFRSGRTAASQPRRASRKRTDAIETPPAAAPATQAKAPSKLDRIASLLARPEGATLDDLCDATGWQVHSVRGAMAGSLKRRGLVITSEKHDGIRRYRIESAS